MEIVPVSPERLPGAAAVLAEAFLDDPMMRWGLGGTDPDDLRIRMTRYFEIINVEGAEEGWVWQTADGAGVAVWLPPEATERFDEDERLTRPLIAPLTDDGGARYGRFWDWIETHVPDEPAWFLDQIGIAPQAQGRGLGRALVEHGLAMARDTRTSAFLETGNPANVGFYERLGFQTVVAHGSPDGGPELWFMRWDP